jgi:hypothetical protein
MENEKPDFTPIDEPVEVVKPAATPKPAARKMPVPDIAFIEDTESPNVKVTSISNPVAEHVVSGGDHDEVHLASCVFKNKYARKSLTVHHLQRRLTELGYGEASVDSDGYFGDYTLQAIEAFRKDKNIKGTDPIDAATFEAIFIGDPNVKVVIK